VLFGCVVGAAVVSVVVTVDDAAGGVVVPWSFWPQPTTDIPQIKRNIGVFISCSGFVMIWKL
jgi:hypothetical protein